VFRKAILLTVVAALVAGGSAWAGGRQWEEHTPMPTTRHEAAVARAGGQVYVMGGLIAGYNNVPLVDIYDIAGDSWTSGPPLPYAPNHAMGAAHGGVVYHLGGYLVALEQPTDRALALVDGAWVELPPMPEARAAGAAEFIGDKLYVIGGVGPNGVVEDIFVFDTETQTWSTMPGPRVPREHLAVVKHDGFLYAVGGRALTFESNMDLFQRFDPRTGRWKTLPALPKPTSGMAAAVTRNDFVVVLGGEGAEGAHAEVFAYDLLRSKWLALPPLEPARTGFGAAAKGTTVYAFHGAGADPGYYDITESIDLSGLRK
jgi:non-specific serine/threonine protein kinase